MKEFPLDHIAIVSRDLAADASFYARLGFTVEKLDADWAMLRDASGRGIALLSPGGAHPPHFALRAASELVLHQEVINELEPGDLVGGEYRCTLRRNWSLP